MNKYGLSDFWYKDMMLTRKKLIKNGKTVKKKIYMSATQPVVSVV